MFTTKKINPLFLFLAIVMVMSIACSSSTSTQITSESSNNQIQIESTDDNSKELTIEPTKTAKPTNTTMPTRTPKPTNTATPPPIGLSRNMPFSPTEIVTTDTWKIQILETKRGDDAWKDIQAANMFNEAPGENSEYILIKLRAESIATDSEEHRISGCDFSLTGDQYIKYTCGMASVVVPDPQIDATLFTGGVSEGWVGFLINKNEGNLLLVVEELLSFDANSTQYIALEEGSSINIPEDLTNIKPNDLGKERNNPAAVTDIVITDDWELSVLEVHRGEEAWSMVISANQYNDPPEEGLEYIAIKIHVKNVSKGDDSSIMGVTNFNTTGSLGVLYDPSFTVAPEPSLDINLYPGGEYVGWIVMQAGIGETNLSLVFENWLDFTGKSKRFISLDQ
ncbi:MAG: DUF4352 domain-containing protein [Anaerolineaceae bacterium]